MITPEMLLPVMWACRSRQSPDWCAITGPHDVMTLLITLQLQMS